MKKIVFYAFVLLIAAFQACQSPSQGENGENQATGDSSQVQAVEKFDIKRGVNISHWLSQSKRRGAERAKFFTEKDVKYIASLGYDHIRLPIDEEQMWDEQGNKNPDAFALLHNALGWCNKHKLKTIVDLHIIRSHHFNKDQRPLWNDSKEQEKFVNFWKELSAELNKYPTNEVAYELMNEAVTDEPENWNQLIEKAVKTIRQTEPERKIVVGSNMWQSVETFDDLRVPPGDKNIILSFHFYIPFFLTHYQASWTKIKDYTGAVHYPGQTVPNEEIPALPESLQQQVEEHNGVFNPEKFQELMNKPIAKAQKLGLQLYCGEWGCLPSVPRQDRLQWYRDVRHVLEKNQIAWAHWDYKGSFGIVNKNLEPDDDLIQTLLKD